MSILREWSLQYRVDSWSTALARCGITDRNLAVLLADTFYHRARQNHRLYDDAISCLDQLSRNHRLALLTNGTSDLQREKIAATGIAKYFAEIVISSEAGYGKPEPQIFEILLSRLNVNASSAWMIGDSLERDILGAKALGIKTVWVNRHGLPRDESIVPNIEVSNLKQLVGIITQLNP